MANLELRDLPPDLHARLRRRAARAGRTIEAEVRTILQRACAGSAEPIPAAALQDLVSRLYAHQFPDGVVDALIEERRREASKE